jgi:hypothetical protein
MDALGYAIGDHLLVEPAAAITDLTAAGTGDNTEIVGSSLDITALASRPGSVCFIVHAKAVLTEAKTLVIVADVEYSADGSTWTSLVAEATIMTLTGDTGGSTEADAVKVEARLDKADLKYVRINATPNLSATGTDTARVAIAAIFGGLQNVPQ